MIEPSKQREFHGVYIGGNPATRPAQTAQMCQDFRIMPGYWLRLRGGRIGRYYIGDGEVRSIHSFRQIDFPGSDANLAQIRFDGGAVKWHWFSSLDFAIDPFGILDIPQGNDGGWTGSNPGAACNIEDRPLFYNGLGLRAGDSKPGLSTYASGIIRFYGLDAYAPSGRPSAAFTAGSGANTITTGNIKFYVGLYNTATNHYSNVVSAGSVAYDPDNVLTGTITINDLGQLTYASNNATELGELKYVFYATIEGASVPYLILNAALNGPFTVPVGSSSASLSIAPSTGNGWVLDLTHEAPTENYPPRRARWVSYVNGRVYVSLLSAQPTGFNSTGDTFERPFDYSSSTKEVAGMTWSLAAGDLQDRDLLGDPLQCFPPRNFSGCPSGDAPIWHGAAPDEQRVLVITGTSTFFLSEQADGLHEWFTISRIHGIVNPKTVMTTARGICWVDQNNMLVMLERNATELKILSLNFQHLMTGTTTCADYLLDPLNLINRYQVWFTDGHSTIYDFMLDEAYSLTGQPFKAAATLKDSSGRRHHVVANRGFYTHEAQAETGLIPTYDETFTGSGQAKVASDYTGIYRDNWNDRGGLDGRKDMPWMDLLVDSHVSAPLDVKWWVDFQETSVGNQKGIEIVKTPGSATDSMRRVKFAPEKPIVTKMEFRLSGHSGDRNFFAPLDQEGDLPANFYGSILAVDALVGGFSRK